MLEQDLYVAIKCYFETLDYQVNGEIEHADVVAVKDDQLVIVEMKKQLNLDVILQAVERQKLSPIVYIASIRKDRALRTSRFKRILHLLERLELGLLLCHKIEDTWFVNEYLTPKPFKHRETTKIKNTRMQLLEEFYSRHSEQQGGVTRTKLMTVYREQAIRIATLLNEKGSMTIKQLLENGCDPKTGNILRDNYYGWFSRVKRGVYELTERGREALIHYPELVQIYLKALNNTDE